MFHRFPPAVAEISDPSYIKGKTEIFAKLKIESQPGKRTVFMTEHTLIFVLKGIKLLHFAGETLRVSPDSVILLRKGVYVMAEYIEEGMAFEALMLFLSGTTLHSLVGSERIKGGAPSGLAAHCLIFPGTPLIRSFSDQLRQYFDHRLEDSDQLMVLKQKEILTLLGLSGYKHAVQSFVASAINTRPEELDFIVNHYLLQPMTIEELAGLTNRSLATFKRDFKRRFGASPRVYINQRRLEHALLLLQNTDRRITDITEECGFDNPSYFIRLFKARYGQTPAALRAKIAIL